MSLNLPPPWEAFPRFEIGDWWKEESLPLAFGNFFSYKDLSVEVGFGHGEFLHQMARSRPEDLFIGIEHFGEGFRKLVREVKKEGTANCLPLIGDGFIVLQVVFGDGEISDLYVNFPDPWPKKRHEDRRLFVKEFFSLAARKIKDGGILHLATDHLPLAEQAMTDIRDVADFANADGPDAFRRESPYPFRTRYETKWMSEGRNLFYFTYEKKKCRT
ncbi:MAG TPA: tRNA (guanosine(46)-N7)-methyltransferase TrmB [Acidobacteriota bacterium]|nr:tRNA (guanosine(46)-N7)-methyltransferase TrmB [Acidobacteriota bacterium]HNT16605.1 tRNA (guanosine(46)-N7)-methyltransferase TrmB [Acidobacteriota bacterium]HPA26692.1 tRNA (guanosine(46)-N7)-methyltransferase TrmB [Acidobacteriota bacterium]HQO19950.1 tRNA (guanosine(46)-N7)-methyltransferase TrmB [Acidobacteriota bacterium]HQQ46789.1 tRNA (guanosine(46)-N7)-methyltransferase TrmB [Acidobacteriota bacterium]